MRDLTIVNFGGSWICWKENSPETEQLNPLGFLHRAGNELSVARKGQDHRIFHGAQLPGPGFINSLIE